MPLNLYLSSSLSSLSFRVVQESVFLRNSFWHQVTFWSQENSALESHAFGKSVVPYHCKSNRLGTDFKFQETCWEHQILILSQYSHSDNLHIWISAHKDRTTNLITKSLLHSIRGTGAHNGGAKVWELCLRTSNSDLSRLSPRCILHCHSDFPITKHDS